MMKNYEPLFRATIQLVLLTAFSFNLMGCATLTQPPNDNKSGNEADSAKPSKSQEVHLDQSTKSKYEALSKQAMDLANRKQFAEAIPKLKKAIEIKKTEAPDAELGHLYGNLGWICSNAKHYPEAADAYMQALKCVPANSALAKSFHNDEEYARRQVLNTHPELQKSVQHSESLSAAGFAAAQNKNYAKAIEHFQQAIDARIKAPADDDLAQLYANLGWAFANSKNWPKAEDAYAKALSIASPNCPNRKRYENDKRYAHDQTAIKKPKK